MKIALPYFPPPLGSESGGGTHKLHEIFRHEFENEGHEVYLFDFSGLNRGAQFYGSGIYVHVPFSNDSIRQSAEKFIELCKVLGIQVVIPLNSGVITSVIPHLPSDVKIVMHCNSIVSHAYYHVTRYPKHVSKIIVESLRQQSDLQKFWNVPGNKICIAPNGINPRLQELGEKNYDGVLKLVYLGRLEDASKGTDLLPGIVEYLIENRVNFDFEVIGSGPDEKKLRESLEGHLDKVSFSGSIRSNEVLEKLSQKHILLMPSRIEGFGFVALEAMSVGVVPIVSRIPGVLDWIVTDDITGFVRDTDRPKDFGEVIVRLDNDRDQLQEISRNAFLEVIQRFSLTEMVRIHLSACESAIISDQPERPTPLPFSKWRTFQEWNPSTYYKIRWRINKLMITITGSLKFGSGKGVGNKNLQCRKLNRIES